MFATMVLLAGCEYELFGHGAYFVLLAPVIRIESTLSEVKGNNKDLNEFFLAG